MASSRYRFADGKTTKHFVCVVAELQVIANCVKISSFAQQSFYGKFTCGFNNENYRLGAAVFEINYIATDRDSSHTLHINVALKK